MSSTLARRVLASTTVLVAMTGPRRVSAQDVDSTKVVQLPAVTVTATREASDVFSVPAAVTIIDSTKLVEQHPNNAVDQFRDLPGLDINGTGPNQTRPTIRGMRGQRVLMLEDGIPLANARRQSDFGEIPSLVDVTNVQQVEVVRGPMSVLYGSDAIGGVVNLITRSPLYRGPASNVHGTLGFDYGSPGSLTKVYGGASGQSGGLGFLVSGSYRNAGNYTIPAGTFGNVNLPEKTYLYDSKVQDWSGNAYLGYKFQSGHGIFARFESYSADHAGFGYVDPTLLGPGQPFIQINYPDQRYWKTSLGYNSAKLNAVVLDRLDVTAYYSKNKRHLATNIDTPAGPGMDVAVNSLNFTDMGTAGFRVEAKKVVDKHLFTYGVDYFRDVSENSDSSLTTLTGFGPPPPIQIVSTTPTVPNASLRSMGAFAQGELHLIDRTTLILGARYQNVNRQTRSTPGISAPLVDNTDGTVVGAGNLIVGVTKSLNLIGAVGRGFRSANLVESFFNGPVPEVNGIQIANPSLKPETNLEFDFGGRYRTGRVGAEAWYFNNTIHDGIRTVATGDTINGQAAYQNQNVSQLRYQGVELQADVQIAYGFAAGANYTYLTSKDVLKPNEPIGDTYPHKVGVNASYRHPSGRFWAQYDFRYNAEQTNIALPAPPSPPFPVGSTLPSFSLHNVRGGFVLYRRARYSAELDLAVLNIANKLYAETANQAFFRAEPRRQIRIGVLTTF
ncbi:MAG TPA: TonB-dependent receptor [Gemmatimonadales bacterium]|nr:TonB-dependent receptor [Gemmatimonadales bacterium]